MLELLASSPQEILDMPKNADRDLFPQVVCAPPPPPLFAPCTVPRRGEGEGEGQVAAFKRAWPRHVQKPFRALFRQWGTTIEVSGTCFLLFRT